MKLSKRYIRRAIVYLLLAPLLFIFVIMGALYVPPVQDMAVRYASTKVSKSLGMQVHIDRLRLTFPLDLQIDGVSIMKATTDTLISLEHLSIGISPMALLSKQIYAESLRGNNIRFHYTDSLNLSRIASSLSEIEGRGLFVNLKAQSIDLGLLRLDGGNVLYHSIDTLAKDTTATKPIEWNIRADALQLNNTKVRVDMPIDSLILDSHLQHLNLQDVAINLTNNHITLGKGLLECSTLSYSTDYSTPASSYLNYNHVQASDVRLEVEQLLSQGSLLNVNVSQGKLRERSGFNLENLKGKLTLDSTKLHLRELALQTDYSGIYGELMLPWSILKLDSTANTYANIDGSIGAEDIRSLTGQRILSIDDISSYDISLKKSQLTEPIDFNLHADGTLSALNISEFQIIWGNVLDISAQGKLNSLLNARQRRGQVRIEGGLQSKAQSLMRLISPELSQSYALPSGLTFVGTLDMGSGNNHIDLQIKQGNGSANLLGLFVEQNKTYQAKIQISNIDIAHFMPKSNLGVLSVNLQLRGQGLNPTSRNSHSDIQIRLHQLAYGTQHLKDITLDGSLKQGELSLSLNSFNPSLNLALQADALFGGKETYASILLDAYDIDLKAWQLTDSQMNAKFSLTGELRSNLKDEHMITSLVNDLQLNLGDRIIKPNEVLVRAETNTIQSDASIQSGDLTISLSAKSNLERFLQQMTIFADKMTRSLDDITKAHTTPSQLEDVIDLLPEMSLQANMGSDNALKDFLAEQRIALGNVSAKITHSPDSGLYGFVKLQDLRQDTMRINAIDLTLHTLRTPREALVIPAQKSGIKEKIVSQSDSLTLALTSRVFKKPYRAQEGFDIRTSLTATLNRANLLFEWLDDSNRSRHKADILLGWNETHYYAHLLSSYLRLGYQTLQLNPRNYIALNKVTKFLRSDLRISGNDKMLIALEANDSINNTQEIHLSIEHLRLEDFKGLGLPNVGGSIFGDIRYSRVGDINQEPIITGDISAQNLRYEDKKFGHLATALFYQPRNNSSHYITADVSYQGLSALSIDGIYHPNDKETPLSGTLSLTNFPLQILNPFLTPYITSLKGGLDGKLSLSGKLSAPNIGGSLNTQQASVTLDRFATEIRLDSIPLKLENSTLHFNRYALTSNVDTEHPLFIDGNVILFGKNATKTNLSITTEEMLLLNQPKPKSDDQLLYGRLIASTDIKVTGLANALKVRGRLSILGGTNCTYIMREDPLDVTDKMGDLVSFVDFSDTLFVKKPIEISSLGGLDMNMSLHFDPSVRFGVDLTADGRDYMRVQGGGNMQFTYPPYGQMRLIGRYEMSGGGRLSYTMPVVGSKLFSIDPSGYLLFNGDIANPYINFVATQNVKASTGEGKNAQKTNFVVSIKAQDHINNIKLGFDLSAPENLAVQNSLSTMTAEERGKQAIGLLGTGIYLAGNRGGKFNIDGTLSSLLQNQITKAAGTLLQDTDLDIGMEVHDGTSNYTDYTYSFSRRFYNDRIRIVVGGKIQSGNVPSNKEQTLIDNVALEYQLDKAGEQHLRLFHKRITDDILESEYTETGAGYIIKRKLNSPWDLFRKLRLRPKREHTPDTIATPIVESTLFVLPTDTTSPKHKQ